MVWLNRRKAKQFQSSLPVLLHQPVQNTGQPGTESAKGQIQFAWRILLTLLLLALLFLLSTVFSAALSVQATPLLRPLAQSSSDPLVLALYYTWFDENTWSYDKLSDLPAEQYVSRDRGAMGRQIDQARNSGIDAFLVAWYGPGGNNQTEPNLAALLDEAAARNFKIGLLFETDSPFMGSVDATTSALSHALTVHANHPAFLRVDGRPVIFFWRTSNYSAETWRAIRNQVDPNNNSIWIADGVNTSYLSVFDGHHLYSNTWNPPSDLTAINQKFARLVDTARQQTGAAKFWVATVMPGYNDLRARPGYGFAQDRQGGAYYEGAWQAALSSHPNWVVITSFNEWPEGTYIEPSAAFGDQYLGLTAKWSGQFKAGGGASVQSSAPVAPAAVVAVQLPPTPIPTPLPAVDRPTAFVAVDLLNVRSGPGTDTTILAQVTAGLALPIIGQQNDWWQVRTSAISGWVYGPLVTAAGPLTSVPVISAVPVGTTAPAAPAIRPSILSLMPTPTPAAP